MAAIWLLVIAGLFQVAYGKGSESRVECSPDLMTVTVPMDGNRMMSYLDQLKDYKPCAPTMDNQIAVYKLDLEDPHRCGVTRIVNKLTGKRTYYHKIVVEDKDDSREVITVRCSVGVPVTIQVPLPIKSNSTFGVPAPIRVLNDRPAPILGEPHAVAKRAAADLPLGFEEPKVLDISKSFTGAAPEPQLGVVVKQNGQKVSGEISVNPGTPLQMEIFLDNNSAPVYGLLVNYMQVTDTKQQQETIIFNGCSIDPYLFDNFITDDGDVLRARFRAFKFPDTNYVQFTATVTVCLDKCPGVSCSNGVLGYGRKRRAIDRYPASANNVYEVELTAFIKVGDDKEAEDVLQLLKNLQTANQMLESKNANGEGRSFQIGGTVMNQNGARVLTQDDARVVAHEGARVIPQDVVRPVPQDSARPIVPQDSASQAGYVAEKMENRNILLYKKPIDNSSTVNYASYLSIFMVLFVIGMTDRLRL